MKILRLVLALCLLCVVRLHTKTIGMLEESPLRIRVPSDVVQKAFHRMDQGLLKAFENMELGTYNGKHVHVSLVPKKGSEAGLTLTTEKQAFAIESSALQATGKNGDNTVEVPISTFRIRAEVPERGNLKVHGVELTLEK